MSNIHHMVKTFPIPLMKRALEMIKQAAAGERISLTGPEDTRAMMVAMGALLSNGGDVEKATEGLTTSIVKRLTWNPSTEFSA